jgi:filamentous hemagglutinin
VLHEDRLDFDEDGGDLTPNQAVTYPAAQGGYAVGAGRNAAGANMQGPISPTQVVIIRPKP